MGPKLTFLRGVSREVRTAVRAFVNRVEQAVRFEHEVPIVVVPAPVISVERDAAFGGFCHQEGKVRIIIGGAVHEDYKLPEIINTVAHELVHYEQWRDGRELGERGVAVRARNIVKQAGRR